LRQNNHESAIILLPRIFSILASSTPVSLIFSPFIIRYSQLHIRISPSVRRYSCLESIILSRLSSKDSRIFAMTIDSPLPILDNSPHSSLAGQRDGYFQCGFCEKRYNRADHLTRHVRSRQFFSCRQCCQCSRLTSRRYPREAICM
jgi:hypothetical protein